MILTVTLNAAIDRTVAVPNFRLGQRHRAVESQTFAGGKGVNVARALKLLDRPVIVAYLMVIVFVFIAINLIVDLLYTVLDPRVRLEGKA